MRDALETTHEITKLIKYSPRREGIFQKMKESLPASSSPGVRVYCALLDGLSELKHLLVSPAILNLYKGPGKRRLK